VEEDDPSTEDVVVLISSLVVSPSVAVLVTSASVVVALDGTESEEVVRSSDVVKVVPPSTVVEVKDVSTAGNDVVSTADVEATSLANCVVVVEPITILIPLSTLSSSSRPGAVS
jgi:hypothetical protein